MNIFSSSWISNASTSRWWESSIYILAKNCSDLSFFVPLFLYFIYRIISDVVGIDSVLKVFMSCIIPSGIFDEVFVVALVSFLFVLVLVLSFRMIIHIKGNERDIGCRFWGNSMGTIVLVQRFFLMLTIVGCILGWYFVMSSCFYLLSLLEVSIYCHLTLLFSICIYLRGMN